jgi:phosphomannomutase/phosphoglucomutase
MKLFGSSGTRGVVGEELTPTFVTRVAAAAATVWDVNRVAIGRDTRTSGKMLTDAATAGLASTGTDVDRLGIVPTPAITRYCEVESMPGLMITASHNPPEYNGIKLIGDDGVELTVEYLERIEDRVISEEFTRAAWDEVSRSRVINTANDEYVDEVLARCNRDPIADADLTVALDPGHGAGALTSPRLFRELGCEVITVNAQPDGHFPGRDPEPVPENLGDLARLVRTTSADVGIAHDGDADRAIFFDENGQYIEGDASLAALSAAELDAGDTTVAAVTVSQRLVDVVEQADATLELTPVGSTNIITRIRELRVDGATVPVAGEGNGGIFFPAHRLVRDGAFTAAKFLELLTDRPASEVIAPHSNYYNDRRNLRYDSEAELDVMLEAAETFAREADAELTTTDGYRLSYGDAWVLVRPSGTEPKVRIYAEAGDQERASGLADTVEVALREAVDPDQ